MAIRREILYILVLLLVIVLLVKVMDLFSVEEVVEADASNFVLEELHTNYPTADVQIMGITSRNNKQGGHYFEVKAKVTEDPQSPCPKRSHLFYNYPAQNFVPQPPEIITRNCVVCTEGLCTIAFPEEATIASHTFFGTEKVNVYILSEQDAVPLVEENPDSWTVVWNSETALSFYVVKIHRDGTIMNVSRLGKF